MVAIKLVTPRGILLVVAIPVEPTPASELAEVNPALVERGERETIDTTGEEIS